MKKYLTFSAFFVLLLTACGGKTEFNPNAFDLTNQTLTSNNPNCESYVGSFASRITDESTGNEFNGSLTISTRGTSCAFETNQIPNHNTGAGSRFATDIDEVNATLEIPASPTLANSKTALSMGANAILLNGVKWEAFPAACFGEGNAELGREAIGCNDISHPWRYNIGSPLNNFGFDEYDAHVQPGGLYHYHSSPVVLYDLHCEGHDPSPVIGFAADGFPIYGRCFADSSGTVREAVSSYQVKDGVRQAIGDYKTPYTVGNVKSDSYDGQFISDYEFAEGIGDLDECNGMTINGQYGYYVTDAYPYVLACYSGTVSNNFR